MILRHFYTGLFCLAFLPCFAQNITEARWVRQQRQTKAYRFELLIWGDHPDEGAVYAVKVISRKTGKTLQVDSACANLDNGPLDDMVSIQDCNFDGYPDFYFFNYMGNVNSTYNFYLFNPKIKRFIYNDALSQLTDPWFDKEDKIIGTSYRGSASNHGSEEYTFTGDTLERVSLWDQDLEIWPEFSKEKIGGINKNGIWTEHTFRGIYKAPPYQIYAAPSLHAKILKTTNSESYTVIDQENKDWYHVTGDTTGWVKKNALFSTQPHPKPVERK